MFSHNRLATGDYELWCDGRIVGIISPQLGSGPLIKFRELVHWVSDLNDLMDYIARHRHDFK